MTRLQGSLWEGVALRRTRAAADPDAPSRAIALPAAWDDAAAAALAALVPAGERPVSLPRAAEAWIGRATTRGLRAGTLDGPEAAQRLAEALRALLLTRRGTAGLAAWRGGTEGLRFVLSLPAFLEAEGGFDAEGFAEACAIGVRTLDALSGGKAERLALGFADLAGLLAGLGLAYDSDAARDVAAALSALARGAAEAESARLAARLGARAPSTPPVLALIPAMTAVPGLAEAATAAMRAATEAPGLRHAALLALAPADATEALLGAETAGVAPAAGATRAVLGPTGVVEVPSQAALRIGAPDRIARLLAPVSEAARQAMHAAAAPFLHAAPPAPLAAAQPPRRAAAPASQPWRAPAPRPGSAAPPLHVAIGGHRVALHRALDGTGQLLGIGFSVGRGATAMRTLLDGFAAAVSLGLTQGVPLTHYVETFAHARIGPPGGVVTGDPDIRQAVSVLDWAFRRLAIDLLGRRDLGDPEEAEPAPTPGAAAQAPLLPLDLPRAPLPGTLARAEGALPGPPRRRRATVRLAG